MIEVVLLKKSDRLVGFRFSGHAGYAEAGQDIVCAGISTAVQMTANGITECAGVDAEVEVKDNFVSLMLPERSMDKTAEAFLKSLELQVSLMAYEYPENIDLSYSEV